MRAACLLIIAVGAAAADPPETPAWTWKGRLGAFMQNVSSHNAETSRDPAITGTSDSLSWTVSGEASLVRKVSTSRFEQRLKADYGRIRSDPSGQWTENSDSIAYEATYEGNLSAPQFLYGGGTADTVFTGPEPDEEALDPFVGKVSSGYGQRYDDLLPIDDSLSWRFGIYARKRWESHAPRYQTDVDIGPETYIRYESKQSEDVEYFVQGEAYGEFDDPDHISCLGQAGLRVRVAKRVSVEVKLRAYYEARPKEADEDVPGYDLWSLREEALVGLVWEGGS